MKNSSKQSVKMDMLHGSLFDKMLMFAMPLAACSILQQLFNSVGTAVVGRFASSEALAAVGSNSSVIALMVTLFSGISLGSNVVIANYIGQNDTKRIPRVVHTAVSLALLSGVFLLILGQFVAHPILLLMGAPKDIIHLATLYLRIYFLGMPFFMLYNYGAAILRAIGDTKRPLIFLIISGIANAALNMILVILFHMGVAGVAIGTIISQLISCVLVLTCLYRSEGSYQLRFSKLKINGAYMEQIFQVGVPAGIQSTVINLSNALLQSSVNSFGSIAMAGYTAANNMLGFLYMSVNSITQACMSFTSQNYGVGKYKRMDRVLRDCMILSVSVSLIMGILVYVFGPELLHIYTSEEDVIQCGMEILAYTTLTYFFCGLMDLFPGALRGMGHSTVPMILSIVGTVGLRIVWIFLLFPHNRSLDFLFISYPASWILTFIMQIICFYFVRKKVHRELKSLVSSEQQS